MNGPVETAPVRGRSTSEPSKELSQQMCRYRGIYRITDAAQTPNSEPAGSADGVITVVLLASVFMLKSTKKGQPPYTIHPYYCYTTLCITRCLHKTPLVNSPQQAHVQARENCPTYVYHYRCIPSVQDAAYRAFQDARKYSMRPCRLESLVHDLR